jgi:hypothetical protein
MASILQRVATRPSQNIRILGTAWRSGLYAKLSTEPVEASTPNGFRSMKRDKGHVGLAT